MNAPYDGDRDREPGDWFPPASQPRPTAQSPSQQGAPQDVGYQPDGYQGGTSRPGASPGGASRAAARQDSAYPRQEPPRQGHGAQDGPQDRPSYEPGYTAPHGRQPQPAGSPQSPGVEQRVGQPPQQEPSASAQPYRDRPSAPAQPQPEPPAAPPAEPPSVPQPRSGGSRAGSLLKSSAVMAAGTIVSRLTGFVRTLVTAAAIGVATLNDSYQVANTLPTMIYILVGGGALNAVFIPQLVRAMKNDEDGGEAYANRLLTLVVVGLAGVTTVMVLGAPLLIRMLSEPIASDPARMAVAVTFARFCLPTMFFMGVHVVLGQILNARGRFGAMMWTPVLNNVIIIASFGAFIWAFGPATSSGVSPSTITPAGVRLLGIGTLLGLVVQALAMLPYLREAGFRIRFRFDWRGHGLGHAAKLAKWTFFFVLANQAGNIVVTQLATAAGIAAEKQGHGGTGITAYLYAQQLWGMPQAIITVSVMTAVLPRISRAAADGDSDAVRDDLSYGLRTSAVAIVPCAFAFLALGVPLATLMYGESGRSIGFVLMGFALGLIPFSVQYVVLRGFYAYEDTRTPFYNTVIVAAGNAVGAAVSFLLLPARWAVVGMAVAYGLAYAIGITVAVKRLRKRMGGDLDGRRIVRTYARLVGACLPAALIGGAAAYLTSAALGGGVLGSLSAVLAGGVLLLGVFFVAAKRMRIEEMTAMVGMVRGRLGR